VKTFFSTLWKYWKKFGQFLGDLVGRGFLMLFYITIALPFGLGVRLFGDPLEIRQKDRPSAWKERTSPEPTIDASYNQF
jgi:hypothetical protein